jgi:hypothetical protein
MLLLYAIQSNTYILQIKPNKTVKNVLKKYIQYNNIYILQIDI